MRRVAAAVAVVFALVWCPAAAADDALRGGWIILDRSESPLNAPELHFVGQRGEWLVGLDIFNHGGGGYDFVPAARVDPITKHVEDVIYLTPNDYGVRVGIGITPPALPYRLQTGGQGPEGGLAIIRHEGNWGYPFAVVDSNGTPRAYIDGHYRLHTPRLAVDGVEIDPQAEDARITALERKVLLLERRITRLERRR